MATTVDQNQLPFTISTKGIAPISLRRKDIIPIVLHNLDYYQNEDYERIVNLRETLQEKRLGHYYLVLNIVEDEALLRLLTREETIEFERKLSSYELFSRACRASNENIPRKMALQM